MAFVDFEKAFDKVNWHTLLRIVKKRGIKYRERTVICTPYRMQSAVIRIEGDEKKAEIK